MLNHRRKEQLQALVDEAGWDALLLYGNGWRRDYFRCLIDLPYSGPDAIAGVTRSGEVFTLFSDPWDVELARSGSGGDFSIELAFELEPALRDEARIAKGAKLGVAGLELMEARFVHALEERIGRRPESATARVQSLRLIKLPEELAAMRRAAALADDGYQCFVDTIRVGMAEYELVAEVEAFLKSKEAADNFMLVSSGGTEVRGMKPPTERTFQPGDCVSTELTPQVDGYYAQICRSLILGEPSPAQLEAFDMFFRAQEAAQEFLRPGVNISDVARVENDVFREAGFGEYTGPKYTRVRGHGLGLFVDDYPHILEDVDCVVQEGMVLIAHPNTYLPTVGYMVFGDTLLVTENGCTSLAKTEKKLFHKAS